MRCVALAEYLTQSSPSEAADALAALISKAGISGEAEYLSATECLIATLSDTELVPYETRSALYQAAMSGGHPEVGRLLFDGSPVRADQGQVNAQMVPERSVVPRGRVLTLGERKALARTHRRDLLVHFLRDPHPDVVRVLMGNPHLTESDVVTMAARRPAVPDALAAIAASERWSCRYQVKRALALNPYTPLSLALRLVTTLRAGDWRAIIADQGLAQPLREQAAALLGMR